MKIFRFQKIIYYVYNNIIV